MDYSLPCLKVLVAQLRAAAPVPSVSAYGLGALRFQRAWVQGVLVAGPPEQGRFVLDDGSGLIELVLTENAEYQDWKPGMYVLVIGAYIPADARLSALKVHKIVDLSQSPDREAVWHLEVIEAFHKLYQSKIQA